MPDVPVEMLIALIAASAYSAWAGSALARPLFFFAPTVLSFLVIVVSRSDLDLRNLLPFWGQDPRRWHCRLRLVASGEYCLLLLL